MFCQDKNKWTTQNIAEEKIQHEVSTNALLRFVTEHNFYPQPPYWLILRLFTFHVSGVSEVLKKLWKMSIGKLSPLANLMLLLLLLRLG